MYVYIDRFSNCFFPSTSHLWNSLPSSVFPASFNLPSYKRQVLIHLRDQMTWLLFSSYILILPSLDILAICFILVIAFLFPFLRDIDSRKGTLTCFLFPIIKKYVYMYVCNYVCSCLDVYYVYLYVNVKLPVYACMCVWMYLCECVCMYAWLFVY